MDYGIEFPGAGKRRKTSESLSFDHAELILAEVKGTPVGRRVIWPVVQLNHVRKIAFNQR